MKSAQPDRAELAYRQWRKARPDLDPYPMALLGRLNEASSVIMRDRLAPVFASFGLQPGEFDVLATLRRSGAPFALAPTALYAATMISSGGMTNRIDKLERAGLVERRANLADRRGTLVALTKKGRALIDKAVVVHIDNERAVLAALSEAEQTQLDGLLKKLIAGLSDPDPVSR
ncbi:MarR family winged helix-turn-helix transcriptional regulator [Bauldia sp.]|uniref:MarR family winged helix-turn-helix transcriptional regulator n=1 Tax=Bauldia sp. TaxID=2575872 RepID=UPI003BAD8427